MVVGSGGGGVGRGVLNGVWPDIHNACYVMTAEKYWKMVLRWL